MILKMYLFHCYWKVTIGLWMRSTDQIHFEDISKHALEAVNNKTIDPMSFTRSTPLRWRIQSPCSDQSNAPQTTFHNSERLPRVFQAPHGVRNKLSEHPLDGFQPRFNALLGWVCSRGAQILGCWPIKWTRIYVFFDENKVFSSFHYAK